MKVRFFATYRDITHVNELEMPAPESVRGLLLQLSARFGPALGDQILSPDKNSLGRDAIVLVDGRHICHLNGIDTPLDESNTVAVFPLIAGG